MPSGRIPSFLLAVAMVATQYSPASASAGSPEKGSFPLMQNGDLAGGRVAKEVTYEGKGLYGYIDGGAELYLEYGFRKLVVEEFVTMPHRVTVEIYQMESPQAAFGIFSISRYKCTSIDTLTEWACLSGHQLQMAIGDFYIRIVNGSSSEESQATSLRVASVLKSRVPLATGAVPALFGRPLLQPYRQGLKYMAGKLGLQNGFPDWSDRFEGFENFKLFMLPIAARGGEISMGLIRFPNSGEAERFRKLVRDKPTCYLRGLGPSQLIFAETAVPPEVLKPYLDALSHVQPH